VLLEEEDIISEITSAELIALISRFPALVGIELKRTWLKLADDSAITSIKQSLPASFNTIHLVSCVVDMRVDSTGA